MSGGDCHPISDFGWWQYFQEETPLGWLLEGYQGHAHLAEEAELRLRLVRLRLDMGLTDYFVKVGHPRASVVARLFADDAAWFGFEQI